MVEDATDAFEWVYENICKDIILGGSSAGGYLASTVSAFAKQSPFATLLIYGLLNFADKSYYEPGKTVFGQPPMDTSDTITMLDTATKDGKVIDGYQFPENPATDLRLGFVAAMHQDAIIPDYLTGISGLSKEIGKSGPLAIPDKFHKLFEPSFGLTSKFPPAVLIHGEDDIAALPNQGSDFEKKVEELGVKTHLELVPGVGHGFDI